MGEAEAGTNTFLGAHGVSAAATCPFPRVGAEARGKNEPLICSSQSPSHRGLKGCFSPAPPVRRGRAIVQVSSRTLF